MRKLVLIIIIISLLMLGDDIPLLRKFNSVIYNGVYYLKQHVNSNEIRKTTDDFKVKIKKILKS